MEHTPIKQKIAVITGASRGIGEAIALRLAEEGYHLVLNARGEEALLALSERIRKEYPVTCIPVPGDIGREETVEKLFAITKEQLGIPTLLVYIAGFSQIGLLTELPLEQWEQVFRTNLTSVFLCSRRAASLMLEKKEGKILTISSVWGEVGASCEVAYSASKGAVNAFTKALAKELAPSHISVNALACGAIDTAMNQCFSPEERQELCEEIPMGRMGTPGEVAEMVRQLAEAPEYLTGQIIRMDGGWI